MNDEMEKIATSCYIIIYVTTSNIFKVDPQNRKVLNLPSESPSLRSRVPPVQQPAQPSSRELNLPLVEAAP